MSLSSILNTATSGLSASQAAIRTVSQNVANVNTPGYGRVEVDQNARSIGGRGLGVEIGAVRRASDRFLQDVALGSSAYARASGMRAEYLDAIQASFGDPTGEGSLFGRLDAALGAFEAGVTSPGSLSTRRASLAELQGFLSRLSQTASDIARVRSDADRRVGETVDRVNVLLADIVTQSGEIQRGRITGDSTGAEERQSRLVDELAGLIDIRVTRQENGILDVRTTDGTLLASATAGVLVHDDATAGQSTFGRILLQSGPGLPAREIEPSIRGGALRGLLNVRDQDLTAIAASLGEFAGRLADALNAVHSQSATLPPLQTATGRDTGLLAGDALSFSGRTTIAVVNADGSLARRVDVDFDLGTISVNGAPAGGTGATVGAFTASLNTALGGAGAASFANGVLRLGATAPGTGLVFDEPPTGGSRRGDKAFAHFFGLNDLVTSGPPTSFATGLKPGDAHGFVPGSVISMRLVSPEGAVTRDVDITVPPGTMLDLVNALNDTATGLGLSGGFGLDPSSGRLRWAADPGNEALRLELTQDTGPRAGTTRSFGALFGLSRTASEARATSLSVNAGVMADPRKLGFAQPDLATAVVGDLVVGLGDSRGAQALFAVSAMRMDFDSALGVPGRNMSLGDYVSSVAGEVGTRAATASADRTSAEALKAEADTRRSNVDGVNLDEELIKLTTYQQAYAAAARMIRAADEMYQALLQAV